MRIGEKILACLIIFSYFIPFISISALERQTVSILEIIFNPDYNFHFKIMTGFLFIPIIVSIITIMVNSMKYTFVSFFTGISVIFGIAPNYSE